MKLLLDTHIWLWSLLEPARLSRRVATALDSAAHELWLSPISVWEAGVLCDKKRVVLDEDVEAWLMRAQTEVPLHEAPLTAEIVMATRTVKLPHRDPADRFLVATTKVLGLTLVTADRRLIAAAQCPVLPNR